jgi:pimeloyl-ACP methyl ester carboxylesterase
MGPHHARVTQTRTVRSADGVRIAYDVGGSGPPLVFVNGALSDRSSAGQIRPLLEPFFTTYAVDRRGRGESGDDAQYRPGSEVEDLRAVLEVIGEQAFVYGHSSGGVLALDAAAADLPITALAVYEPPYVSPGGRAPYAVDLPERLGALLAADDRDGALRLFLDEAVGLPEPVIDDLESGRGWPRMVGMAHTVRYDALLVGPGELPGWLSSLQLPVLVMAGSATSPWLRASARALSEVLPQSRYVELAAQTHQAAPEAMAEQLRAFFGAGSAVSATPSG